MLILKHRHKSGSWVYGLKRWQMQLKNSHLVYFILPWLIYEMIWVVQYIVPLEAELRCKGTLDVLFLLCHCFPAMEVQPAYQLLCFSLDWNVSTSCGWIIAKAGKHIYGLSVVLWFRMKYCISPAFWCIHIKNSMQIFMCSKESFCFWLSPDFSTPRCARWGRVCFCWKLFKGQLSFAASITGLSSSSYFGDQTYKNQTRSLSATLCLALINKGLCEKKVLSCCYWNNMMLIFWTLILIRIKKGMIYRFSACSISSVDHKETH